MTTEVKMKICDYGQGGKESSAVRKEEQGEATPFVSNYQASGGYRVCGKKAVSGPHSENACTALKLMSFQKKMIQRKLGKKYYIIEKSQKCKSHSLCFQNLAESILRCSLFLS